MKFFLKAIGILIGSVLCLGIIFILYLTITDYRPEEKIVLEINNNVKKQIDINDEFTVLSWNIGYAGLGENEDFFMDGGTKSKPGSKKIVEDYLSGIVDTINQNDADCYMLQEVDINSAKTYRINELDAIRGNLPDYSYNYACNYRVAYVPAGMPPMGKVETGQVTFNKYNTSEAYRYAFPGNYKWPVKVGMLDRCFSVSKISLTQIDKEIVLLNAHFSAYDDGSLRLQQLAYAKQYLLDEYSKGNYVILGGDWNQTFECIDFSKFPLKNNGSLYTPYPIPNEWLDEEWQFGVSDNAPTYRLLDTPYVPGVSQTGIIDGFVVSPNIEIQEVQVLDLEFKNSDHNPVYMKIKFKQ